MHPFMIHWWNTHRPSSFGEAGAGFGFGEHGHGHERGHEHGHRHGWHGFHAGAEDSDGGGFGVRRPLRFLAYKLGLDEDQVAELARVLNELKTERAQVAVDDRRTVAAFADGVSGEKFDEAQVGAAAAARVKSAERLKEAVVKALSRIHAVLRADQRAQLAYLIRTGTLSI